MLPCATWMRGIWSERVITTWSASPLAAMRPLSYRRSAIVVRPRRRASTVLRRCPPSHSRSRSQAHVAQLCVGDQPPGEEPLRPDVVGQRREDRRVGDHVESVTGPVSLAARGGSRRRRPSRPIDDRAENSRPTQQRGCCRSPSTARGHKTHRSENHDARHLATRGQQIMTIYSRNVAASDRRVHP